MIDDKNRAWMEYVQAVDQEVYERYVEEPGANTRTYSFTPNAESVIDADEMSFHEWPDFPQVDFLCVSYDLAQSHLPFHYLRFWTQRVRVGGRLLVFVPRQQRDWLVPHEVQSLDGYLVALGFSLEEMAPLPQDYWARASLWQRVRSQESVGAWGDLVPVHGGSLSLSLDRCDHGILVAGLHGVGKTSIAIRLMREGRVISDQGYKGPTTPPAASSAGVRLVSDSWTDISAFGIATGACTDSKLVRIRNRDRRRWGLCEASQDDDGKTLWAPEDVVGAKRTALRADSCQPSMVLWPTLPSANESASDLELHPSSPYSTVGLATPSQRAQRLRAQTRLPYLGHNLPAMRNLRARVHSRLAALPHFNVLTPSFSLSHCLELLATLKR